MKRTPLARRSGLARGKGLPRIARRRAGYSRAQHAELEDLHRQIVMARAKVRREVTQAGTWGWKGPCEHCGNRRWLSVCHIEPKGQYPGLRYEPENAWAGCYRCHIHWWHKNPGEADAWIREKMGSATRDALHMRALQKQKKDFVATRMYLSAILDRLAGHEVGHRLIRIPKED